MFRPTHSLQSWLLRLALLLVILPTLGANALADGRKTVVIVGGGYGGVETATRLAKDPSVRVVLLDKAKAHTEVTRLHQSAAHNSSVQHSLADIAAAKGFEFRNAEVTGIKLGAKKVQTTAGAIRYDSVVVAVGGVTSWPAVPGLKQHGIGIRTPWEAKKIRTTIHENLAKAGETSNTAERQRLGRIVIAGAGSTGVEMAAELAQAIPALAKQHGLSPKDISVHLVQRGSEILSKAGDLKPRDRALIQQKLQAMGVIVHTNTELKKLTADSMSLKGSSKGSSGKTRAMKVSTVVWAGGVKASPAAEAWGLPIGKQGRILVDGSMRIQGSDSAYAIGDAAAAINPKSGGMAAMTAQEAKVQAKVAAKNVVSGFHGKKLTIYKPKSSGTLVSLGNKDAVGRVLGIRVRGRFAAVMKKGIEFKHKSSLRRSPLARVKAKARAKAKVAAPKARAIRVR
tara:strand:+ start:36181 stop:37542 length:1362 start_codon:yes stop_codon:yes gene_type:complete